MIQNHGREQPFHIVTKCSTQAGRESFAIGLIGCETASARWSGREVRNCCIRRTRKEYSFAAKSVLNIMPSCNLHKRRPIRCFANTQLAALETVNPSSLHNRMSKFAGGEVVRFTFHARFYPGSRHHTCTSPAFDRRLIYPIRCTFEMGGMRHGWHDRVRTVLRYITAAGCSSGCSCERQSRPKAFVQTGCASSKGHAAQSSSSDMPVTHMGNISDRSESTSTLK